ncbi:MAG: response regulator, partial [Rectinemataceae bacterium]|nr:response regulator [Rectinemataceae bacterium]
MGTPKKSVVILIAEDDDEDYMMTVDALQESRIVNPLYRVQDGEDLMEYLLLKGRYLSRVEAPLPSLILLDLNMPRKDGREALQEIKAHADLRKIPVVVLTTSEAKEDIARCYELGASSYI